MSRPERQRHYYGCKGERGKQQHKISEHYCSLCNARRSLLL
jgi:hypothetical protein